MIEPLVSRLTQIPLQSRSEALSEKLTLAPFSMRPAVKTAPQPRIDYRIFHSIGQFFGESETASWPRISTVSASTAKEVHAQLTRRRG